MDTLTASSFKVCGLSSSLSVSKRNVSTLRKQKFVVKAAKLPSGVQEPKVKPDLPPPTFGFTTTAEIWNSRASMIGLFALVALEFAVDKGILEILGFDVGKGLNLPL